MSGLGLLTQRGQTIETGESANNAPEKQAGLLGIGDPERDRSLSEHDVVEALKPKST
jgi:hypothetical protein